MGLRSVPVTCPTPSFCREISCFQQVAGGASLQIIDSIEIRRRFLISNGLWAVCGVLESLAVLLENLAAVLYL